MASNSLSSQPLSCGGARLQLRDQQVGIGGCSIQHLCGDLGSAQGQPIQEIDVNISMLAVPDEALLQQLSHWLGQMALACRDTLRSLLLSGPLCLATIFGLMAPHAAAFQRLEQVCLARGGGDWQPAAAASTLRLLPALKRVQFRFSFIEESPPQDLVSLLLLPPCAPLAPPSLQQLHHLALIYPIRSVVPPTAQLPEAMSLLTQLTSLKLTRIPVVAEPQFLGCLTNLRYLAWDPALPADMPYTMPPGLEQLTRLACLWIVTQFPLCMPGSLAGNLEGLHVIGRGFHEEQRLLQHWGWLQAFSKLRGMRLQGLGMDELPPEIADKSLLTRLDLMCNSLEELPEGPYLGELQRVHLGNNHLQAFPSALLHAKKLEELYLANQSASTMSGRPSPGMGASHCGSPVRCGASYTERLELMAADVEGLLALPCLRTVVMGNLQPVVQRHSGGVPHDFTWLQRMLKRHGCRLTSEELAYELQTKAVFDVQPLALEQVQQGGAGEARSSCSNVMAAAVEEYSERAPLLRRQPSSAHL